MGLLGWVSAGERNCWAERVYFMAVEDSRLIKDTNIDLK